MQWFLKSTDKSLQELRTYWERWWNEHKNLAPVDIGRLAIERDIRLLETSAATNKSGDVVLYSFLSTWTGEFFPDAARARAWWKLHNDRYSGPPEPND
mgnify:CR=1 FL=1